MERIVVTGGTRLTGDVTISGAKNAVLPILAASLLPYGQSTITEVPNLADVIIMLQLLESLGAKAAHYGHEVKIDASELARVEAPYEYVRKMRASFLVMGPLLARLGSARISLPGGCAIGTRPIDLHLKGFAALGAEIIVGHGFIEARAEKLRGNQIYLDFPSVGATENVMMAAVLAEGLTILENAAAEPEIIDLANYLNGIGARVKGAGTNVIRIEGVKELAGTQHAVIPDRIEAGTFLVAGAMTGGNILVKNLVADHIKPVIAKLKEAGAVITEEEEGVRVIGPEVILPVDIKTLPYPGFPTDMQAQMMALLTIAKGTSVVAETVFENRFMHIDEFRRMGADIKTEGKVAIVTGVERLTAAPVKATDLRAGAALILSGLVAKGITEIGNVHHIDRGYEGIEAKLKGLGAQISREVGG